MVNPATRLHCALSVGLVLLFLSAAAAWAQSASSKAGDIFKGFELKPLSGQYLAMKDANVRAAPETKSKKIGSVRKGSRVEAVGKAKGAWLAVRRDGRDLGFVYELILVPLIDGALEEDIEGKVMAAGERSCRYVIHFEGKSPVANDSFEISDYTITFRCESKGKKFEFPAYMFITEAPYQLSKKQVFQISIDLREVGDSFEKPFSTTMMYRRKDGKVIFDSVNQGKFKAKTKNLQEDADDVEEALSAAVGIAVQVWNTKVWRAVGGG
ncbi:MAG TPA: SH3 domain-containing protein [Rhodospirillales bacterium]|jgi:hypothetical protein|nr:SH3 domain-containing protein [Rhodospirillales bacterium]